MRYDVQILRQRLTNSLSTPVSQLKLSGASIPTDNNDATPLLVSHSAPFSLFNEGPGHHYHPRETCGIKNAM